MTSYSIKIPLTVSILLLLFFGGASVYLYKITTDYNKNAEKATALYNQEKEKREEIRTLDRTLKEIAIPRAKLDTHFAYGNDVVPFLNTLEKLAPLAGAKSEVTEVETLPGGKGLDVGLKVSGSFSGVYKFITLLENSPYELNLISINIEKPEGNTLWDGTLRIRLITFIQ